MLIGNSKTYSHTKWLVIFSSVSWEDQTIILYKEPSHEFLESFMKDQGYEKVTVEEVSTEVQSFSIN